ncbi:aminopeptidase P family protein [Tropicimonas sp. IMCC34043]|uniref:aminopeptidase P family protein n=1 Tax=Tropicimonas sp. IMCC34043 TaxID=2248760 RepID=UPI000E26721A|nr:aminopeptidase P family protein [Tropicimonas sp. IMCC34043]
MFQSFDAPTRPEDGPPRLALLRTEIAAAGLDGFLVPRADVHQGEYVAAHDDRLAWLTGFTGSAGFCAVLDGIAGVFVDGRYRLQVRTQVDLDHFTPVAWPGTKLGDWLVAQLPEGGQIGFDPRLHTVEELRKLSARCGPAGIGLVPTANLIDRIWADQPAPPLGQIAAHPLELAGQSHEAKRATLAEALRDDDIAANVLTLPDSIAWLLNIRGSDIPRNPVPHAFAMLHGDGSVDLFCAAAKVSTELHRHLGTSVRLAEPEAFGPALQALTGRVRIDPSSAPVWVAEQLKLAEIVEGRDPCLLPKARKTAAEIAGMEAAHLRDGAAMCRFLAWLDAEAPKGGLTEIAVVRRLEQERRQDPMLRDISFDTIAGTGPHGAIVHYRVTEATDRAVTPGELLLIDSGAQYLDGTTDITRTVATGPVTDEQRACFTRVLKGMIALSQARWPKGLAGRDLDPLARIALWRAGQDYDHGTGHGVGAYLSVHEGPQRISRLGEVALDPGMVLSNEPGYYREGEFGIRIENLIHVVPAPALPGADDRPMLAFRTLTWVPIDRRLIEPSLLSADERTWLDIYHAAVRDRLSERVEGAAGLWLDAATAPL